MQKGFTPILEDGENPKSLHGQCSVCGCEQNLWTDEPPDCIECGEFGSVTFLPTDADDVEYLDVVDFIEGVRRE